jgi:hypothetical protein
MNGRLTPCAWFDQTGPDWEQIAEQHWNQVDAAYEQWRDAQLLRASNKAPAADRTTFIPYGHVKEISAGADLSLL